MTASHRSRVSALTVEQEKQFQAWRAEALEKMPYFARLIFSLRVLNAPGLGTWAVDAGHRMYIDFDEVIKKGLNWNVESVLHEASHLFAEHFKVREELGVKDQRGLKILNVANDLSINDDLDAAGCVTFRSDKMLPEFIGEPDNQTPHYYFGVLNGKVAQDLTAPPKVRLTVRPREIRVGHTKGTSVIVTASPAYIDPSAFTLSVQSLSETEVAVTSVSASAGGVMFTLDEDLGVGSYNITVSSAGKTAEAALSVVQPSIALDPDHLEGGWVAPQPITVRGKYVKFTTDTAVTLVSLIMDPANPGAYTEQKVSGVGHPTVVSSTEIRFDIEEQIPDGIYLVKVVEDERNDDSAGADQTLLTATLPVGLPHMTLSPQTLPVGLPHMTLSPQTLPVDYHGTPTVEAICADFDFNQTTTFTVSLFGLVTFPHAVSAVNVKNQSFAELTVANGLPKASYVVIAETAGERAYGTLAVSDAESDDAGDGAQGDESEDEQNGGAGSGGDDSEAEPFRGCGSGAGGEKWDGELDLSDDFDGTAPAMSEPEKQSVQVATAAAIKDYVAKGRGKVPGGLVEIADKVLAPSKTPWQKLLSSAVRRAVASKNAPFDVDRSRRHRRKHNMTIMTSSGPRRLVVPGHQMPVPSIHLIRDTSGSMSASDIAVVTRECEAIAKKIGVRGDEFIVTDVDAAVHQSIGFKGRDSIKQVAGRGGTNMIVGIEHAWEAKQRPTVVVVATDGGTPWPSEPGPVPVIACLVVPEGMADYEQFVTDNIPEWIKVVVVEPGEKR